jgi:hypothetical protein
MGATRLVPTASTVGSGSLLEFWPSTTTLSEVVWDVVRVEVVQVARPNAAGLD